MIAHRWTLNMAQNRWLGGSDDWTAAPLTDWSAGTLPGPTDDVVIDEGVPIITTDVGTINSLSGSGHLSIESGGVLDVSSEVNLDEGVAVDDVNGSGGGSLTVEGTLTGQGIAFGNAALSAPSTVTLGQIASTSYFGVILAGNIAADTTDKATLDLGSSAAPSTLQFPLSVTGDAELVYGSGAITATDQGGRIVLDGATAQIDVKGSPGNDSALALGTNDGSLELLDGASYATPGDLVSNTSYYAITTAISGSTM